MFGLVTSIAGEVLVDNSLLHYFASRTSGADAFKLTMCELLLYEITAGPLLLIIGRSTCDATAGI